MGLLTRGSSDKKTSKSKMNMFKTATMIVIGKEILENIAPIRNFQILLMEYLMWVGLPYLKATVMVMY